jgi:dipeptidyl aminopeptidase/acylaminoacyl peptidase
MAQRFDLNRTLITGEAITVAGDVGATSTGYAAFSASDTGVIVYAKHIRLPGELRWLDRSGNPAGTLGTPAEYLDFELSPDERTIAVSRVDPKPTSADVWLLDLARNVTTRFTVDPQTDASALWSPDGGRIVFRSNRHGFSELYQKRSSGTEPEQPILDPEATPDGGSEPRWRRDGNELYYLSSSNRLMSVPIPGGNAFDFGVPKALFETRVPLTGNPYRSNYAVTADGQRFLINTRIEDAPSPINIILNWTALLRK